MARTGGPEGAIRVGFRLFGIALAGTSAGIFLVLLPGLPAFLPVEVQIVLYHPLFWLGLAVPPVCLGAERFAAVLPRRWAAQVAARARWVLGTRPLAGAVQIWEGRFAAVGRRADSAAARLLGPLS